MRYMVTVKSAERGEKPPRALMEAVDRACREGLESGALVSVGGLMPTSAGARMRISGGRITVTDGPFTEAKEVVGGFAIYEVASKEEALERTRRFLELHEVHWPGWEGECEIREMATE